MDQDIKTVIQYPVGATEFDIPFDYLSRKFVRVSLVSDDNRRLLSNITEYRYVSKTRVKLLVATTGFDRVEIRRFTSASERVVDFSDGSVLRALDLNVSQLQSAHIAEEARDSALMAMPQDDAGNLDARNRRIVRLAPGIDGTDAVNKTQLDTSLGEAGGILSEIKEEKEEFYEYLEKFADDTTMLKGVVWVYNSGSAIGGETALIINKPTAVFSVPYLEINGHRQEVGYQFDFNASTQTITLAKPLQAGDFVMAMTSESHLPLESLLAGPTGAASIGTRDGVSVQDVLDRIPKSVTPEQFGAFPNGSDCGAQMLLAWKYVATNGGTLVLGSGTYYVGKTRFHFSYSDGIKPHNVVGQGDSTVIKFGDIPPSGLQPGQNWVKEDPLIRYLGNSGTQYIPKVTLEGFLMDYSEQTNKGGTDLSSLSITHPTPYSLGVRGIYFMYALQPTVKGVSMNQIYGDGVFIRKSTMPHVTGCKLFDVSAGNIITRVNPNMASDSNGGGIFIWACHGGLVEDNICWNTRVYKASVTSIDNGTQIKDTLCGYIGIWSEFGSSQNIPSESAPPLLGYVNQSNIDNGWNTEALGCVIQNNTVYGYTIGIKTEGLNEAHIKDNVVLNAYLPIYAANTRSVVSGNWTDMLYCDNRTCPQGGFQSVRASILANNFVNTFDGARVGVTLKDNKCYCTNYAGFRVNRTAAVIEGNMFRFARGAAWPFDVNLSAQINGVLIRDNLFFFDSTVTSAVTANLQYHVGTQFTGNRFINRSQSLVTLAFRVNCSGLNISENLFDGALFVSVQGTSLVSRNTFVDSATYKGMRFNVTAPSVVRENSFKFELGATTDNIALQADNVHFLNNTIEMTGSGTTPNGAAVSMPGSNKGATLVGNTIQANPAGIPMFYLFGAHFPHIDRNKNSGSPLLRYSGTIYAPVHIGYNVASSVFQTEPASELNAIGNISTEFTPYVGMRMTYLRPDSGGKEGLVYTTTGWKSFGSIS